MSRAQRSIAVHNDLTQLAAEREVDIVTHLVARLQKGTLTWDAAVAGIAQIAELRNLEHIMDYRARKDIAEAEETMNGN